MGELSDKIEQALNAAAEAARNPWGDDDPPPMSDQDRDLQELPGRIGSQRDAVLLLAGVAGGNDLRADIEANLQAVRRRLPMALETAVFGPAVVDPGEISREFNEVVNAQAEALRTIAARVGAGPFVEAELPELPESPDPPTLLAAVRQQQRAIVELARAIEP